MSNAGHRVFAAITVRDRDAAVEFYERLLGASPTMLPISIISWRPPSSTAGARQVTDEPARAMVAVF